MNAFCKTVGHALAKLVSACAAAVPRSASAGRRLTRGVTMNQVLVAMLVFSITLGAITVSFSMALKVASTSSNQMTALHYARSIVDQLRTNSFTNAVLNAGTYPVSNTNYRGNYIISSVDTNTKNLTVNVVYTNRVLRSLATNTLYTSIVTILHP